MRVVIDVHEKFDDVISITLIGTNPIVTSVTSTNADLNKGTYFQVDKDGKILQYSCADD